MWVFACVCLCVFDSLINTRKENIFKTATDFDRTRAGEIERRLYFEIEKKKRKRKKEQGRGNAAKNRRVRDLLYIVNTPNASAIASREKAPRSPRSTHLRFRILQAWFTLFFNTSSRFAGSMERGWAASPSRLLREFIASGKNSVATVYGAK